jgi:hypothetical protein
LIPIKASSPTLALKAGLCRFLVDLVFMVLITLSSIRPRKP